MPRMTTIVNTELRAKLYEIGKDRSTGLSIMYDTPWGEGLHYLDLVHERSPKELNASHVDTVLDEKGLRFNPDRDV